MEPTRQNPQDIRAAQADPNHPAQPARPRPFVSDFGPRRSAATGSPLGPPRAAGQSAAIPPTAPTSASALRPVASPPAIGSSLLTPPDLAPPKPEEPALPDRPEPSTKPPKERSQTGHAGWVGFVVFVVLTAVLLLPLLPGKILDNFPGSSQSFSTGDQSLACLTPLSKVTTTEKYDSKLGFPIVYAYSSTTTQQATCAGKVQDAIGGHSSQFNPLGGAIDIAISLAVAFVVAKIWRKLFGLKHHY